MISFERTTDYELVRQIVTHPRVYPYVSDDFSPKPEDYKPIESEAAWYIVVRYDGDLMGLFAFYPENAICWKIHTCLLPTAYGHKAREIARVGMDWIWRNAPCLRIITDVPKTNRLALKFALEAGLRVYGVNEKSYMKHGVLQDQVILGISKA